MKTTWRSLYPYKSRYLDVAGVRLHYVREGDGPQLLMVHGNPTWSFYWRNVINGLKSEYQTIAVDHVGCGLSDKPEPYDYCLDTHIKNLTAVIDSLDLRRVTLVAHDWGGAIGLGAALARRDRVAGIILFNTAAFPPPFIPWRIRACRIPGIGTWAIRRLNLFARAAIRMAVRHHERMTGDVRSGLLAPYDSWDHRVAIDRFVKDIPASSGHRTWKTLATLEQELPQLSDIPCQLVWGMRDWCFRPVCLDRLLQNWPRADVYRIHDASHYVIEDSHELIVPRMRSFLETLYGDHP